jgi:NhaP-type Na+/H+ or K+/H+ antiporter
MPHGAADAAIVAALVFAWGALSARLERFDVTAPIIFVVAGLLLTHGPLALLHLAPSRELVKLLAEVTLALVLFSDASRVGLHELRADLGLYVRLLGVALPLTIGLGMLLALFAIGSAGAWIALLAGAALAPTDAALGAGMMANPAVPARVRRLINVESGLNDGIATPFVSVALAGVAAGNIAGAGPLAAVRELGLGLLTGVAVGAVGGYVVRISRKRGWTAVTVLLSVVAHGVTAEPLTRRYVARPGIGEDVAGDGGPGIAERRLSRRGVPAPHGDGDAA